MLRHYQQWRRTRVSWFAATAWLTLCMWCGGEARVEPELLVVTDPDEEKRLADQGAFRLPGDIHHLHPRNPRNPQNPRK